MKLLKLIFGYINIILIRPKTIEQYFKCWNIEIVDIPIKHRVNENFLKILKILKTI